MHYSHFILSSEEARNAHQPSGDIGVNYHDRIEDVPVEQNVTIQPAAAEDHCLQDRADPPLGSNRWFGVILPV